MGGSSFPFRGDTFFPDLVSSISQTLSLVLLGLLVWRSRHPLWFATGPGKMLGDAVIAIWSIKLVLAFWSLNPNYLVTAVIGLAVELAIRRKNKPPGLFE